MNPALSLLLLLALPAASLALAIRYGGPRQPVPMASIAETFGTVDMVDLPAVQHYRGRDGERLAYRHYKPDGEGNGVSVVLIHGSSSRSESVSLLARTLCRQGCQVYSPDVRGHGESGSRGRIAYIGQLEDDLEDFLAAVQPPGHKTLIGFSAGGGFALRFAADPRGTFFDSYILLAPFLSQHASTYRPSSGGWVSVGLPRLLALGVLNGFGITAFNHLPVTAYALAPEAHSRLTPRYSYALAANFRPHADYKTDIGAVTRPLAVLVGARDDQFFAEHFADEFAAAKRSVSVDIVPDVGHADIVLSPTAAARVAETVDRLVGITSDNLASAQ